MKYILIISLFLVNKLSAQQQFIFAGKVEYEKRFNQHQQLDDYNRDETESVWITEQKKVMPKVVSDSYTLLFSDNKSIYKLTKENTDNKYIWGAKPAENDMVIIDLQNGIGQTQREVFENTYLIKDSIKKYEWRITNETRTIAGFECKKAVTKICDSVYVVAFYTDQIITNVGPENFNGLPGLILGLAIPRLHTTWFATKVELVTPTTEQLSPKIKGKATNWVGLQKELTKAIKDWGVSGARYNWMFML